LPQRSTDDASSRTVEGKFAGFAANAVRTEEFFHLSRLYPNLRGVLW
jgi:hypothetical protein